MYLSIIQHVTFTVTKVIFKHGFFTLTQVWIWVKDLNTSTFNQSGPRVGSGSACLSCCSLTCPLDGAILKHLTLLLPHKVCRRGNWGNHLNWKQLVKLESHISGVKLFFILTFPDACQRTHTHSCPRVCVCVCQRLFWPLTTSTFLSCVFDSTLSPDRTCGLSFCFFQDLPGTVVPSMQLLPLNYESVRSASTGSDRMWLVYDLLHCEAAIIKICTFQLPLGCTSTKQDERLRERGGTYKLMRKSHNSEMFVYLFEHF